MSSAHDLLDVNVWIALAHPGHVHHEAARTYWSDTTRRMAFCRTSLQGFLRLLTQPAVMGEAVHTADEAWTIYDRHLQGGRVDLLEEPSGLQDVVRRYTRQADFGWRDWTDAWLAGFALAAGCRMVSFDGGFRRYPQLDFLQLKT